MKRRICFVSLAAYGYFAPGTDPGGGAERQLYLLSQELKERFDVQFVVGEYGQPRTEKRQGVTLHRAYTPDTTASPGTRLRQLCELYQAMARADADVYVYRGRPWKATVVYLLARLLRRGFVYNVANDANLTDQPESLPLPIRRLFVHAIRDADAVIAQTDRQVSLLRSTFDVDSSRVPNGYPLAKQVPSRNPGEYFLWVGRLDEQQKRPHLYLDLAERLPSELFLLAGPGGEDEAYTERIRSRADSLSNVKDVGMVDPDSIHELYPEAFALVNTSAYEGFPNTFLEAWRYGTPVLSYEVDPSRFVEPELEGCADGDFDEFVRLAGEVTANESRRRHLAKPATEYFENNLTIQSIATSYGDVLVRCLDEQ